VKDRILLLVEDNPDDVDLTLRALRKNNITNEIIVVHDGAEALDCLFGTGVYEGKRVVPAVVLLDLKLPKVDGMEVLKKVRADEKIKLIPVIILTSSKEEQDLINGYKYGCNSYVRKPVEFDEFTRALKDLGLYWLLLNEPPPDVGAH
jgi:CheY-like chemotaxis protein